MKISINQISFNIVKNLIKSHSNTKKPKHLLKLLNTVPASMGVYYLHNSKGDVIYIGKSKNMKRRINHTSAVREKSNCVSNLRQTQSVLRRQVVS